MALFHRISGFNDDGTDSSEEKIPSHQFAAGLREAIRGNVTRAQLENAWGLAPTDLDDIVTKYQSVGNTNGKLMFIIAIEDWAMLAEQRIGVLTEAAWDARVAGF